MDYELKQLVDSQNTAGSKDEMHAGHASTGLGDLDEMLGGCGLPRATGITVDGPPNVGKRTLCMQILFAALRRGEACTYVSYRDTWRKVLEKFSIFNWNVLPYLESGSLKIVDNASVLAKIDLASDAKSMNDAQRNGIVFCRQLEDTAVYCGFLSELVEQTLQSAESKRGGIGVIDSIGIRIDMLKEPHKATRYLQELRIKLAEQTGLISLHIHTPTTTGHRDQVRIAESGHIELKFVDQGNSGPQRWIRIVAMRGLHFTQWHKFNITADGVKVWKE